MKFYHKFLLAALVVLALSPSHAALAASDYAGGSNYHAQEGKDWVVQGTQEINSGATLEVKSGGTLVLDSGSTLTSAGAQTMAGIVTLSHSGTALSVTNNAAVGTLNGNTITTGTGVLTLQGSATVTGPASTGTLATLANAETLTNKTLTDYIDTGTVLSSAISATSGTTGTTLTNIPGLSVPVTAGKAYSFRAYITGTSTANSGLKLAFANSGSTTSASYTCSQHNATTNNAETTTTTMGNAVGAATTVFTNAWCEGVVVVNAGGNLTMQFAQNASHADTTTVNANGYMIVRRMN